MLFPHVLPTRILNYSNTGCTIKVHRANQSTVKEKGVCRMTPLIYTHNTSCTATNLSHTISSALDLWSLSQSVFILRAMCHCLNCRSAACRQTPWYILEKYAAKATTRESALVPGMCFCLRVCLCVCHCLLSPLLSLARQWPFTTKCHSGQYVRKTFGMKEGRMAAEKEKERGEWQGNDSECMDSLRTKGTMCRVNEEGFCVFCAATMPE